MKKYHIWNFNQNIFVPSNSKEGPQKVFPETDTGEPYLKAGMRDFNAKLGDGDEIRDWKYARYVGCQK